MLRESRRAKPHRAFKPIKTFRTSTLAIAYREASRQNAFREFRWATSRRCRPAKNFRAARKTWDKDKARADPEFYPRLLLYLSGHSDRVPNVRFRGWSGHKCLHCKCLLLTQSRHGFTGRLRRLA